MCINWLRILKIWRKTLQFYQKIYSYPNLFLADTITQEPSEFYWDVLDLEIDGACTIIDILI